MPALGVVVPAIAPPPLIRNANLLDLIDVFEWRNETFNRSMFVNNKVVSLKEHTEWYKGSLKNPLRKLYIGEVDNSKVGIVRFDRNVNSSKSEVSINLNPKFRGKGYGYILLSKSLILYENSETRIVNFVATVKKENKVSLRVFEKCNFYKNFEDEFFIFMNRNLVSNKDLSNSY